MPVKPNSIIPELIEQVFQKYGRTFDEQSEKGTFTKDSFKPLFIELDALFGDVLKVALRILDEQKLTIYTTDKELRAIVEITEGGRSQRVVKLLPDVNYCQCKFFAAKVLQIEPSAPASTTTTAPPQAVHINSYTCQHVLALRLAILLRTPNCPPALALIRRKTQQANKFAKLAKKKYKNHMQHSKTLYQKGILKNLKMLTQTQYSHFKFVGRLDHVKTIYAGIKALYFGDNAFIQICEDGLRIIVESGKTMQASFFMTTACFDEFHVDGIVNFGININVLIECLGAFSSLDCSMKMFYKGTDAPLLIVLEPHDDENISTECAIKTTVYDEPMDYSIDEDSASLNVICIRGPDLANIFHDIDKSAVELALTLSPRSPFFKIDILGVMLSESSHEVSKSSNIVTFFNCREHTKARYKNSQMKMTAKAMSAAEKVAIKTDAAGLLELQFMLHSENDAEAYIQFFLTPVVEYD